jgi:hypothetical protein
MNDQTTEDIELANFCKYLSDSPSVINGIFKSQKIRFTQPAVLNDPLEFNPSIKYPRINTQYTKYSLDGILLPSADDYFRKTYIIDQINNYGILSLTRIPDSFSMWNFYSNGHKGAALVFKVDFDKHSCMLSPTGERYPLEKVTYDDEYSFSLADVSPNGRDEIPMEEINNKFFFKKTSRWVDEQEWRMVRPIHDRDDFDINELQKLYLFDFSLDCIESIIFGAMMSVENKILIQNCCKNYQLSFLQAVIIRNGKGRDERTGKIILIPEDSSKPNSSIFQMGPNSCIFDEEQIRHKETLSIKEISEHPYFDIDKEFFLNFYERKLRKQDTQHGAGEGRS